MYTISIDPADLFDRAGGIEEGFAMMERAGIEGIQFGMRYFLMPADAVRVNLPVPLDAPMDEVLEKVRPYKEAAAKHHIRITQVHAPHPTWMQGNAFLNERMPEAFRKTICIAAYLESPYCVIHPAFSIQNQERHRPDQEWELNRDLFTSLIPALKRYHVMVLLENMFSKDVEGIRFSAACSDFAEAADWVDWLNQIAQEELFGFCLDTGHCQLTHQNLPRAAHLLGKRIKALHMHDNSGHLDDHRAPYTGTIHWDAFLESLRDIDYQGDLNFEAPYAIQLYPAPMTETALRMLSEIGRYFRSCLTSKQL